MDQGPAIEPPPPLPTPARAPAAPGRRLILIELLVVIALAVLPDLLTAILALTTPATHPGYGVDVALMLARSIQVSAVVLYLIWRSPEGPDRFGLRRYRIVKDTLLALALFVVLWASHYVLWHILWHIPGLEDLYARTAPPDSPYPAASTRTDIAAVIALSLANGFTEQLVISAYLATRLRTLLRSAPLAALTASLLFTSYHIYQGPWALPSILVFGLICTSTFLISRRLWPLALAHAGTDAAALLSL